MSEIPKFTPQEAQDYSHSNQESSPSSSVSPNNFLEPGTVVVPANTPVFSGTTSKRLSRPICVPSPTDPSYS